MKTFGLIVAFACGALAFVCGGSYVYHMIRAIQHRKPGVSAWQGQHLLRYDENLTEAGLQARRRMILSGVGAVACFVVITCSGIATGVFTSTPQNEPPRRSPRR